MTTELLSKIQLRKAEAERLFAAVAFMRYEMALEQCGWMTPDMFTDPDVKTFWKGLKEHGDKTKAAIDAGIFGKITVDWFSDDIMYGRGVLPYAEKIASEDWFYAVASHLGALAAAIGSGDLETARRLVGEISEKTPKSYESIPDAADIGIEFISSLDDEGVSIPSGLPKFDLAYGGFWRQNLYVICARPGVGKTAFELQCARNIAAMKYRVLFQSLEMSSRDLWARAACGVAQIPYRDVVAKRITEAQKQKIIDVTNELIDLYNDYLFIDDKSSGTTDSLWQQVANIQPDIVFVDHLRLENDRRELNEVQRLGIISWNLKKIAKEFDIPVVAAAQLNRNLESRQDKRPELADLRDSGQIEENADVVVGIHRERKYVEVPTRITPAELVGLKFRNGPGSMQINLSFDGLEQWFKSPKDS